MKKEKKSTNTKLSKNQEIGAVTKYMQIISNFGKEEIIDCTTELFTKTKKMNGKEADLPPKITKNSQKNQFNN